jgi:hypothetical protein
MIPVYSVMMNQALPCIHHFYRVAHCRVRIQPGLQGAMNV